MATEPSEQAAKPVERVSSALLLLSALGIILRQRVGREAVPRHVASLLLCCCSTAALPLVEVIELEAAVLAPAAHVPPVDFMEGESAEQTVKRQATADADLHTWVKQV